MRTSSASKSSGPLGRPPCSWLDVRAGLGARVAAVRFQQRPFEPQPAALYLGEPGYRGTPGAVALNECIAKSICRASSASSISLANRPLPPISSSKRFCTRSPVGRMMTISIAPIAARFGWAAVKRSRRERSDAAPAGCREYQCAEGEGAGAFSWPPVLTRCSNRSKGRLVDRNA
jgi:hypothetical protein